jgi:transposase InsO family protein
MCKVLQIARSTYYYELKSKPCEKELTKNIIDIFKASRNNYGTRKIKKELAQKGEIVSRRRIGRIMKKEGLVSKYTIMQFKPHKQAVNESETENIVARKFDEHDELDVVVSDLTYVRVNNQWNYICILLDLFNREIIGYSIGAKKDASLVMRAFASMNRSLEQIKVFHTDRGSEFKNKLLDQTLDAFKIRRSLSYKGTPYDNAVAEAAFKVIKTEFVYGETFETLDDLKYKLFDYINWYNHHRIHSTLDYLSPIEYRQEQRNFFV